MQKEMNNNNKVTVVVPFHDNSEEGRKLLDGALKSLEEQRNKNFQVVLVCSSQVNVNDVDVEGYDLDIMKFANIWGDSYYEQINNAVEYTVSTDYFTILQYDDKFRDNHILNTELHIQHYPNVSLFLSYVYNEHPNGDFAGLNNEFYWSTSIDASYMGSPNLQIIKKYGYKNLSLAGAVFKKSAFLDVQKFKTNLKLYSEYEFLMRLVKNSHTLYIIPKITYSHQVNREGSITSSLHGIKRDEVLKWKVVAESEYLYKTQREIE